MDFLTSLDPVLKGILLALVIYIADVIATKTAKPLDNLLVRALKRYADKTR